MEGSNKIFMERCFQIARFAKGENKTNPMVGAVLVHQNIIIGEGFHKKYGEAHAEINALENVKPQNKNLIPDSTLYVSLEPCSHTGKTPPCAHTIIQAKIKKVVIGCKDPNPLVAGKGIEILQNAGIKVHISDLEEANLLIAPFKAHLAKRPYVTLKWAKSYDNYISKIGEQSWLSNQQSKIFSHILRSKSDAILVGKNTVIIDNPSLTTRLVEGPNPKRIVLDSNLSIPKEANVLSDQGSTIIFNTLIDKEENNKIFIKLNQDEFYIKTILEKLFSMGILNLIVEGGAEVIKSFITSNLWDEAVIIKTDVVLKEGISSPNLEGRLLRNYKLENDDVVIFANQNYEG